MTTTYLMRRNFRLGTSSESTKLGLPATLESRTRSHAWEAGRNRVRSDDLEGYKSGSSCLPQLIHMLFVLIDNFLNSKFELREPETHLMAPI